jgi:hypothetical protein
MKIRVIRKGDKVQVVCTLPTGGDRVMTEAPYNEVGIHDCTCYAQGAGDGFNKALEMFSRASVFIEVR